MDNRHLFQEKKTALNIKTDAKISSTKIIVGSTNPDKLEAVLKAFEHWRGPTAVILAPKIVDSKINSQPVGLAETRLGAINRMKACSEYLSDITQQEFAIAIGLENGIVAGAELEAAMPGNYSSEHWYDIGFIAVRIYKQGCHFEYVSTTTPLQIPNDVVCGMISPSDPMPFAEKLDKYRDYIMPLIWGKKDLYQIFSNGTLSREGVLSDACLSAFQHLDNIYFHNAIKEKFDTVFIFGTFDLFHDLHRKLLDDAAVIAKEIIVYVNDDVNKYKRDDVTHKIVEDSKNAMIDSPETRRRNVAEYLGLRGIAKLKRGKHVAQLEFAIKKNFHSGKTAAVFGGNDQFENYPQILHLCYATGTPIVTRLRGETDVLLCTTDLKAKMKATKIASCYDIDLDNISSAFFKKRIDSKKAATQYLLSLTKPTKDTKTSDNRVLGVNSPEVWQYHPENKTVKRIIHSRQAHSKALLCLPGRTRCDIGRAKKILFTIHDHLVPENLRASVTCYIACYKQENKTTEDNLKGLSDNPEYFSMDALIYTQLLLLPRISEYVDLNIEDGFNYQLKYLPNYIKKPIAEIKLDLAGITLWARSYGTVIAIEMENAFRVIMRDLGYLEQEIAEAAREICVLSISNLAPIETPRLFTTTSVTGFNDAQAGKYIEHFPEMVVKYYREDEPLSQNLISNTHNVVMVDVPERMTELSTGRIIIDPKRHYTPNYDSIRKLDAGQSININAGPMFIQKELELMLNRDATFDLVQTRNMTFM